jgi:hypothetical protein
MIAVDRESRRRALAGEIERHIGAEKAILEEYHVLLDQLPEGPLSILVNQIATEEEMHHFLLSTIAEWLCGGASSDLNDSLEGVDREAIAAHARRLQEHEQATIDACTDIGKQMSGESDELIQALLEGLVLDSRKHHRLLTALDRIARGV